MHRTPDDMLENAQDILRTCLKATPPGVDKCERLDSQMRQDIRSTGSAWNLLASQERGRARAQRSWDTQNLAVLRLQQYHSRRNQCERYREFLELISRFEFEFCRRGNYERFEFFGAFMWMCRGLFVPTQFHFECCGFFDGSR